MNLSNISRKPFAALAVGLLILGAGTLSLIAQALPKPPFNQAPAVGNDTSAEILLYIDSTGSLRVLFDPSQGPYDGSDDTLYAVQTLRPTKSAPFL